MEAGSVFGLLGPNGAAKTTAVRILTTLLAPDGGTARVAGLDVVRDGGKVRESIGLAGQYAAVDENLSGHENLVMVGRIDDIAVRRPTLDDVFLRLTGHAAEVEDEDEEQALEEARR